MTAEPATGEVHARAALAGNPSDGYGGAVLALSLPAYRARAEVRPACGLRVDPPSELVSATVRRFAREHAPDAQAAKVTWSTTIPRGVGLGGSSAIVIAVLRALCARHGVAVDRTALAELALAVEVQELGIAAGLQDRVVQSYEGLVFMDFDPESGGYEPLDSALLPPLVVAWRTGTGGLSGAVHAPLRVRYERGEPLVQDGLSRLGALARRARHALLAGDLDEFARCVDGSFDQRQRMLALDERHLAMVNCARAAGAAVNYAGSGGAIVAVCRHVDHRQAVVQALQRLGCDTTLAPLP
jgi:galactokinase/mevalonate kinase-like predicted kinase